MIRDYKKVINKHKKISKRRHTMYQHCIDTITYNICNIYHRIILQRGRSYIEWEKDVSAINKYEQLVSSLHLENRYI